MRARSHRHPSLEQAAPEPIQLVDATGGLDEFAPEAERSLLKVAPPAAPALRPNVTLDETVWYVSEADRSSFASRTHPVRAAIIGSAAIVAATAIMWLQLPATRPPAGDPATLVTERFPADASARPTSVSPPADAEAPNEVPSVTVPSPAATGNAPDTPIPRAASRTPSVPAVAPTPVRPPTVVTLDAPVAAPVVIAENTVAAAAVPSLPAAAPPTPVASTSTAPPAAPTVTPETPRSPSTDVPADPAPRPTARDLDTRAIENVLGRYRTAFNQLDAGAAAAVWPTVNQRNLAKAFERLDDQDLSFESCKIDVGGVHAEAACNGTARYVQKVGNRNPKAESRQWRFILRRASEGWVIDHLDAR